ncbi:MAG: protein kinase, partial [Polyangiaceae bacterium]|nr:protein kinase [Polyangiaceae bacterium]
VRRVVADGGMGRVYEALDISTQRRAALKVLHNDVARDAVALQRFKREYAISQLLPHEHIVEVFDFLKLADGGHLLAMEYLEGEELRSLLKRETTLRPARLVRMLSQIAIGLDEAHRRQLIHRDLKPDNIFLCGTRDGDMVKLLDFGSVKDKSEGAKKLTVMGTTIGSPYYMSPEQAQGLDSLDARADVWALAAISYEALAGKVPFSGNNGPSILLAILAQQPLPASMVASSTPSARPIPLGVDDVLMEALAKDPARRIGSVGALADRLGSAYGLQGEHRQWATAPQATLEAAIENAMPTLLANRKVTGKAEADPFANLPVAPRPPAWPTGVSEPAQPVGQTTGEMAAAFAPKGPPWLAIVGALVCLVLVTAGVLYLVMR